MTNLSSFTGVGCNYIAPVDFSARLSTRKLAHPLMYDDVVVVFKEHKDVANATYCKAIPLNPKP